MLLGLHSIIFHHRNFSYTFFLYKCELVLAKYNHTFIKELRNGFLSEISVGQLITIFSHQVITYMVHYFFKNEDMAAVYKICSHKYNNLQVLLPLGKIDCID